MGMRLAVLTCLALLLSGCAGGPAPSDGGAPASGGEGVDAPAWSFTAVDGTTHTHASDANATVLFFMATWCSSCRTKAPVLASVHEDYADRGVRMLSVDFDPSESPDDIARWQESHDQDWPHGLDTGLRMQRHFQVTTQSTVLVLDAQGEVVKRFGYGGFNEGAYRTALDDALTA